MALMVISTTVLLLGIFGKASGCGDSYTTESGRITHPAVSGDYYNSNELCAWIIISPIPLYFYFSKFTTETSYDIVYARDGSSVGAPLINTFSGKSVNSTFITTGDAYIQFRSDSNVVGTGFVLYWKPYSAEEQCKEVWGFCVKSGDKCDGTISIIHNSCDDQCVCCVPEVSKSRILGCGEVYTASNGVIRHPLNGGNYENNEDCIWKINAAEPIKITIIRLDLEMNYDFLYVRDGPSSDTHLLGSFTGTTIPNPVETTQNSAFILFKSDYSATKTGFELRWEPPSTTGPSGCQFPFIYQDKSYYTCTEVESAGKPWCSTKTDDNDNYIPEKWKYCDGGTITSQPPITQPPVTQPSDCDYSTTFSTSHTMNLSPKPECGVFHKTGVSDDEITAILQKHNELREYVAKGLETPQPGATNMLEMQWNIELAEVAQAWAEQCMTPDLGAHDEYDNKKICSRDYSVGQNVAFRWNFDAASEWYASIQAWYDEVEDMPLSHVQSFASYPKVIGHYTQVVWAATYEVGCGAIHYSDTFHGTTYPESKIYVCNYGPGGNYLTQPVYNIDDSGTAAATNCPNGPSSAYPGLCATPITA